MMKKYLLLMALLFTSGLAEAHHYEFTVYLTGDDKISAEELKQQFDQGQIVLQDNTKNRMTCSGAFDQCVYDDNLKVEKINVDGVYGYHVYLPNTNAYPDEGDGVKFFPNVNGDNTSHEIYFSTLEYFNALAPETVDTIYIEQKVNGEMEDEIDFQPKTIDSLETNYLRWRQYASSKYKGELDIYNLDFKSDDD